MHPTAVVLSEASEAVTVTLVRSPPPHIPPASARSQRDRVEVEWGLMTVMTMPHSPCRHRSLMLFMVIIMIAISDKSMRAQRATRRRINAAHQVQLTSPRHQNHHHRQPASRDLSRCRSRCSGRFYCQAEHDPHFADTFRHLSF